MVVWNLEPTDAPRDFCLGNADHIWRYVTARITDGHGHTITVRPTREAAADIARWAPIVTANRWHGIAVSPGMYERDASELQAEIRAALRDLHASA